MTYTAIIVDDEQSVIEDLLGMLKIHCPQVNVVATALQSDEAIDKITKLNPSIVFLDINIDKRSGLDIAAIIGRQGVNIIFVTAYKQYAVNAFRLSAVDYLLKPVDREELIGAVNKATHEVDRGIQLNQLNALAHNFNPSSANKKIILTDSEGLHVLDIPDISWCHAQGSYTEFQLNSGDKIMVSKHLKTYETLLSSFSFVRLHRSYLVNIYNIIKIDRQKGEVRMKNGLSLPFVPQPEIVKEITNKLQS